MNYYSIHDSLNENALRPKTIPYRDLLVQNRHERQFLHDLLGPTRLKQNLRSQCKRSKTRAKTVVEYSVSGMSGFDEWRVDNLQALHGPTRSEMES